jgi:type I restriction enzyme S subunit
VTFPWPRMRLRHLSKEPIRNGVGESAQDGVADWPRYVRITDIAGPRTLRTDTVASLPPEIAREAPLRNGDILISAVGATFGKAYLHRDIAHEHCFAGYLVKVSVNERLLPEFAAYWTESYDYWHQVNSRVIQSTIQNFSAARVKDLSLGVPPIDTQQIIVNFLDRETAQADGLVAKYERLIQLLEEKRVALITQAVTKGFDPSAPTKETGTDWIGTIPRHWVLTPLKHAVRGITVGIVVTPAAYYVAEGVPCLRSLNISERNISAENLVYISPESNVLHRKSQIRSGDLVIVRTGRPGTCAVVDGRFDNANCIDLIIARRSPNASSEFLAYYLNSNAAKIQYALESGGALQQHFNVGAAGSLSVCLPPLTEQRSIVDALNEQCGRLDTAIDTTRRAIALVRERRSALIAAAVTGQINIRANEATQPRIKVGS